MDIFSALQLIVIMAALAALPSSSVVLVITRAVTHGVPNGIAVAAGIVIADLVFVALALLGMSVVAETMGALFAVLKYVGGAYLIWLGFLLFRTSAAFDDLQPDSSRASLTTSFLAGFTLTLGDLKAILFYASLFPNLIDVGALSRTDIAVITVVTILTVGGVKVVYAITARHIVKRCSNTLVARHVGTVAGGILMGTGTYIIAKS